MWETLEMLHKESKVDMNTFNSSLDKGNHRYHKIDDTSKSESKNVANDQVNNI